MSVTKITTPGYTDQSVTTDKLADNAVTSSKIANNAVGTTEIANDSVTTDKITFENSLVPTGAVFYFASTSAPAGYLVCDGSAIPNGTGTVQGKTANFSALRAITGPNLPDLRGEFIRGWDGGRGADSGRIFRSYQEPYAGSNTYTVYKDDGDTQTGDRGEMTSFAVNNETLFGANDPNNSTYIKTINTTPGDTRPRNIALLPCIKY